MRKILSNAILISFLLIIFSVSILSTIGLETNKFNSVISDKINQSQNNLKLKFKTIKFKLDLKQISLFLETSNPEIKYRDELIPTNNVKVYINFFSIINSKPQIKKIKIIFSELDINQIKKLIPIVKPSNFKSILVNVTNGKLVSEAEIYLNENNQLQNFIFKGNVSNLSLRIKDEILLKRTNFSFFADNSDVLFKNIFGEAQGLKFKNGDIKLSFLSGILLSSNFSSDLKFNQKLVKVYSKIFPKSEYVKNLNVLEGTFNNNISINFDKTYKVKDYSLNFTGKIKNANFKLTKNINLFLGENDKNLNLKNTDVKLNFDTKKNELGLSGQYSINNEKNLQFSLNNVTKRNSSNLKIDFEFDKKVNFELINYTKPEKSTANIFLDLENFEDKIVVKKFKYKEDKSSLEIENLNLKDQKILSFKLLSAITFNEGKKNNEFAVIFGKKIKISGSVFDGTNLPKFFNKKKTNNIFSQISKEIEIDIENTKAPLSENLKNFKLIGYVDKGNFVKVSAKGDFGNNKFLDITMKNDEKNKKKYLEIFSDMPQPLLSEFSFFKGLTGGNLLFSSIIEEKSSSAKLKIENFKVINAPGMIKLLSLADLGGLVDLAQGEGISFDILEISIEKNSELTRLNEIYALGPSISVLMDGYQDKNGLTSLRGTLVPAKNLNKLISKIPILGEIIVPKEIGEGLFGISFKMKGPKGKIKTTINPIKTLTPRFIQKIIEKNKILNNFN